MDKFLPTLPELYEFYLWTLTRADERVADWPLMQSPVPTVTLTLIYITAVRVGPVLMKNKKPFNLTWLIVLYNLSVTLLNLYIGVELTLISFKMNYSWVCQPVDYSWNPIAVRMASALWWYYISKLIEFCDTFFFILRKKNSQLTFLHVYHHSTMFMLWWIGIKWVPGGSSFLGAMLNSYVHVLMYLYYAGAALGPKFRQYLWWKKYLTILQMAQFTTAFILGVNSIIQGCDFPTWMQYALVLYMWSFIILFANFYYHAYTQQRRKSVISDVTLKMKAMLNGAEKNLPNGIHIPDTEDRKIK